MKTFVHVLLVAACFVACARGFPSIGFDDSEEDSNESAVIGFPSWNAWDIMHMNMMNTMEDIINTFKQRMHHFFIPDMKIPVGPGNTTSTTKIIDGHVVTINETTYANSDENGGTAFRVRIIDVKPLANETVPTERGNTESTVRPEPESRETVEDFNNEISKTTDTLTA